MIREREHGTLDHLLAMPVPPFAIAMSKVLANGLVIVVTVGLSLYLVVRLMLGVPIAGSIPLFMAGVTLYLFFATSVGIFLSTIARTMPQLGLLFILVAVPLNMLSGSNTPLESMPTFLRMIMQASPSTHFVSFAQEKAPVFQIMYWPPLAVMVEPVMKAAPSSARKRTIWAISLSWPRRPTGIWATIPARILGATAATMSVEM